MSRVQAMGMITVVWDLMFKRQEIIAEWEPELALFVPDDSPLLFYRKIAELGRDMLVSGGRLYFEINQEYGRETVDMLAGLEYKNIELRKDLFQNDRMIKAEK